MTEAEQEKWAKVLFNTANAVAENSEIWFKELQPQLDAVIQTVKYFVATGQVAVAPRAIGRFINRPEEIPVTWDHPMAVRQWVSALQSADAPFMCVDGLLETCSGGCTFFYCPQRKCSGCSHTLGITGSPLEGPAAYCPDCGVAVD